MESPCKMCDFKDEDKNLQRCVNCERRIKYAVAEGMLSQEVLEDEVVLGKRRDRSLITSKDAVDVPAPKKPLKDKGKKALEPLEEDGAEDNKKVQINLYFAGELSGESKKIMDDLKIIAKKELRRMAEQALYFIREGIEKWKGEHD